MVALACFCVRSSAKEDVALTRLAENVYAHIVSPDSDAVANAGVLVLEHSVVLFDTHFTPEAGQALLAAIRSITPKPVRYVINSHAHPDHTHGNQVFADAQLIGSTAARRDALEVDLPSMKRTLAIAQRQVQAMRRDLDGETDPAGARKLREQIKAREDYVVAMSRLKITPPQLTTGDGLKIVDGKQEVRLLFLGKGHTDGDLMLYLPAQRIAFVGDLFFNEAIPNVQDASMLEWIKTLEAILKLDADQFVPGHGPVGSRKDVEKFLAYFQDLQSLVQSAVDRGDSIEQATRDIVAPVKYSSYQFQNFFPANVQKMYAELKALQLSKAPQKPPAKSVPNP